MIYKISGNQRLIWKFYKTDDNKWRWYCHEKNGYLMSQSDNAYNSQLLCIENAKKQGYSDESVLPLFLHISYRARDRWAELLARVLTSKYAQHIPLYRQSEIYGRQGVELSCSLLSDWMDTCCRLLSPLEETLQDYVLTDGKLHADDPPSSLVMILM